MERIINNIPSEYKDNIILIPHPLVIEYFKNTELSKYIPENSDYWIRFLDDTKLLITDYSSISYFAFYRGSNIIFDWSDLDECMEVGYKGALMLNRKNVFGDIVYNEDNDLEGLIRKNMGGGKEQRYIDNYNKIVEFKDSKNSDRIIEKLKEDGFLE